MILDRVILLAAGALGLLWWRNSQAAAMQSAVSVTGATVDVLNVEAIEERVGWQYSGPRGKLTTQNWIRDPSSRTMLEALPMIPGAWYSEKPSLPTGASEEGSDFFRLVSGYKGNRQEPVPDSYIHMGWSQAEWDSVWRREVLTVGQQVSVGGIIAVPIPYTSSAVIP